MQRVNNKYKYIKLVQITLWHYLCVGIDMNLKKIVKIKIIIFCFTSLFLTACATNKATNKSPADSETKNSKLLTNKPSKLQYAGKEHAVTKHSKSGNYRFTLYSKPTSIPLRKIHQWILKIETKAGKPVTNAKLYVNGGMPAHRHGFPTKPIAKKHLGNGEYLVEGIKFTMPGSWEMRFTMKLKKQRERVKFKISIH